jgi:hypothetical protein
MTEIKEIKPLEPRQSKEVIVKDYIVTLKVGEMNE